MGQVKIFLKKEKTKLKYYKVHIFISGNVGAILVWSNEYHIGQVDFAFGQVKLRRRLPGGQVVQKP